MHPTSRRAALRRVGRLRLGALCGAAAPLGVGCHGSGEEPPAVVATLEPVEPSPPGGVPVGAAAVTARVRALDERGAPVRGATVVWVATSSVARPPSAVTDAQGVASTAWQVGTTAGVTILRASVVGGVAREFVFSLEATPLGVARVAPVIYTPAPVAAGGRVTLIAQLFDRYGNVTPPVPVRWRSADPRVAAVDSVGISNFAEVRLVSPGTATITAAVGTVEGAITLSVAGGTVSARPSPGPGRAAVRFVPAPGSLGRAPGGGNAWAAGASNNSRYGKK
jgi:hypothetical protein